jgi:hypothetical protein
MATRTSRLRGVTIVELLVVVAILGAMLAVLLPAVQQARAAARAAQCRDHLKQIGLAVHGFHEAARALPPAQIMYRPVDPLSAQCGRESVTWLVRILPYLDETTFAASWNARMTFPEHPEDVRRRAIPLYLCPERRSVANATCAPATVTFTAACGCSGPQSFLGGATGDYAGNHGTLAPGVFGSVTDFYWGGQGNGVLINSRALCADDRPREWIDRLRLKDVTDGLSKTILAGELHVPRGRLNQYPENGSIYDGSHFPFSSRLGGRGVPLASSADFIDSRQYTFGSWHRGACQFALADGSVHVIDVGIDELVLERLCSRYDGEVVGAF